MSQPVERAAPPWTAASTTKQRAAVQKNVTALLDALAPSRMPTRGALKVAVETHRTPEGCVLQAADAAISVSWFADAKKSLGELHIVVWRGILSRRGAPARREGATIVQKLALKPIEPPSGELVWRAGDGTEHDTASLASHCLALLQQQMSSSA